MKFLLSLCLLLWLPGCPRRTAESAPEGAPERDDPARAGQPSGSRALMEPSGGQCAGRDDCPSDQVCVAQRCRYRKTSVAGEALAASAAAQRVAGDLETAERTYGLALEAFDAADAPPPPAVLCGSAVVSLHLHREGDGREQAAKTADACFRGSLPSDPTRTEVLEAVSRLQYEGLALSSFDAPEPPERFFTEQASRPTIDAVRIQQELPDASEPGYGDLRERIESEGARRIIADCFVQDWELRHQRQTRASLILKLTTRLRDMGDYDIYVGDTEVLPTTAEQDGFEPCIGHALTSMLQEGVRLRRAASWQIPFDVGARLP